MAFFGKYPGQHVTPEEVINLAMQQLTYFELDFAHRFEKAWNTEDNVKRWREMISGPRFERICLLASVFTAGRMQGIREERKRRREAEARKRRCTVAVDAGQLCQMISWNMDELSDEKLQRLAGYALELLQEQQAESDALRPVLLFTLIPHRLPAQNG